MVRVKLGTGDHEWMPAKHVKADQPMMLAKHVMDHPVDRVRSGQWQSWARTTVKAIDRAMRRMRRHYDVSSTDDLTSAPCRSRRVAQLKSKKLTRQQGRNKKIMGKTKYGILAPRNVKEALMLDDHNGNKLWAESIAKEMNGLDNLKCFRYHHAGWRAPPSYQYAPLRMMFDIIAVANSYDILCGDIGNAFVMANKREKIYLSCWS